MPAVTMYTTPFCGACDAAKAFLRRRGAEVTEIDVLLEPGKREEMLRRAGGRRTVPQIFVGDVHVGGFTDLVTLDRAGRLEPLLRGAEP